MGFDEVYEKAKFDIDTFSNLRSFAARTRYCKDTLTYLGSGSARLAFKIDDNTCLKIAKNDKGIAQNEVEADFGKNEYFVCSKIFDADTDDYKWLTCELARKALTSDFKKFVGLTMKETFDAIQLVHKWYCPKQLLMPYDDIEMTTEQLDALLDGENDWISDMSDYLSNYRISPIGDFIEKRNYGVVSRKDGDYLVATDTGLNEEVFNKFYKRKV